MHEDQYGVVWDDEDEEPAVDEPVRDEEPEAPAPVEPVLDEPAGITYTRGPNGRLIPI